MLRPLSGISVVFALLSGCADPGQTTQPAQPLVPAAPPATTTRAYLARPRTFTVEPSSTAQVTAHRAIDGDATETATLSLGGGTITLQAEDDGTIALVALDLELGNIELSPSSLPPDGLALMGVRLTLRQEADVAADWSGDASAMNANARTDLLLDWSLKAKSGSIVPLATQRIANVPFDLAVSPGKDGKIDLDLHAMRDGVFWEWTGLLELSDLKLDLEATP